MRLRKFRIKVRAVHEASGEHLRREFLKATKAAQKKKLLVSNYDLEITFPDLSWLSKIFSAERIRLIQTIRDQKPESMYQLAKLLGRSLPNVHRDVHELAEYGIIELKRTRKKGQKRESLHPEYNWDGFDIAV